MSVKSLLIASWMSLVNPSNENQAQECLKTCTTTKSGIALLMQLEGYSPFRYKDSAGKATIGYGHLIRSEDKIPEPLMQAEAQKLLAEDLKVREQALNKVISVKTLPNQFDAMVSLGYNIGTGNFKTSTVLKKHNATKFNEVPAAFMLWTKITLNGSKIPLRGLKLRRELEASYYTTKNTSF